MCLMTIPRIFISHSSEDKYLAGSLARLLCAALNVQQTAIRCTSIDGYKLSGGADISDTIRKEISEADVFICILSNASLSSLYVLLELGARWGCGKYLIPIATPGTRSALDRAPLSGLNILQADDRRQLSQLLSDVSAAIRAPLASQETYDYLIDEVLRTRWGDPFGMPPVKYSFRRADTCDMDQIHQLAQEIYGATRYSFTPNKLREWVQINPKCFFIMTTREAIVGYIDAFPISNETHDHLLAGKDETQIMPQEVHVINTESSFYIASIVVAPQHRGNVSRFLEKAFRYYRNAYPLKPWKRICALGYTEKGTWWASQKGMVQVTNTDMWHLDRLNLSNLRGENRVFWRPLLS